MIPVGKSVHRNVVTTKNDSFNKFVILIKGTLLDKDWVFMVKNVIIKFK